MEDGCRAGNRGFVGARRWHCFRWPGVVVDEACKRWLDLRPAGLLSVSCGCCSRAQWWLVIAGARADAMPVPLDCGVGPGGELLVICAQASPVG
ncbi:hypothetical protein Dimus_032468 [Dionaea muscipula]